MSTRFFPHPDAGPVTKITPPCQMTEKEWRSIPTVNSSKPFDKNLVRNHYFHAPKITWIDEHGNCLMQNVLFISPPTVYVTPM